MITLRDSVFETPMVVSDPNDGCTFYHAMDIPDPQSPGGVKTIPGHWDLRGRFRDYLGGVDVSGKSVLDIGCASGWISFEVERHGATQVVSVDLPLTDEPQYVPYPRLADPRLMSDALKEHLAIKRSYWLCHRLNDSRAQALYCNIHKVGNHVRGADIVVIGQILVHQQDPLSALLQCARAADDTLVIVEGCYQWHEATMRFCGMNDLIYGWFHLSTTMYTEYLKILGFEVRSMTRNLYPCRFFKDPAEVWTIVAKRVGPTYGREA